MKKFTVLGHYEGNDQIFSHHVEAIDSASAFAVVSKKHEEAIFVAVLDGHISEGQGINFPGDSLVDAETVLSQPEVFGTGELQQFSAVDQESLVEWMAAARVIADERGLPIDEDDSEEAARQAEALYNSLTGILPDVDLYSLVVDAGNDKDSNDDEFKLYKNCLSLMGEYLTQPQTREIKSELGL
jgi:hypothetical protein